MTGEAPQTEQTLREYVAEEIRALMGRRNVSRQTMAKALGVSHTTVWRRLSGETALNLDELDSVARVLGVRVVDLLPREVEGRTVVIAGGERRQTTVAKVRVPVHPHPNGHANRTHVTPGSRRPARLSSAHS